MTKRIMITRPAHQARPLQNAIEAVGGAVFLFPTLEIKALTLQPQDIDKLTHIQQYDMAIFISPNAVEYGIKQIERYAMMLPPEILLATIGESSALALKNKSGRHADIVPAENFSSEGLLANKAMQNVTGQRLVIFRGLGGREHLRQVLQQRGANVDYINVYQRCQPNVILTEITQYLQNQQIAAIVITSGAGLENLLNILPESLHHMLFAIPLLVINKRLLEHAKKLGFSITPLVTKAASDSAILNTLQQNKFLP